MNRVAAQICWCAILLSLLAPVAFAGEKETQENPIYKHWAQFKPGTFVVQRHTMEAAGQQPARD